MDLYSLEFGDQLCDITKASLLATGSNHSETEERKHFLMFSRH